MLKKNNLIFLFKLFIFVALSYYIYITIPWGEVSKVIQSASFNLIVLSICFQFISFILLALRWNIIIRNSDLSIDFYEIFKISLIGVAFNNILPSSIGGDIVRGAYIVKKGISIKNSLLSLITDRVIGLLTILVFICVFLTLNTEKNAILSDINIILILLFISIILIMLIFKIRLINKIIENFLFKNFNTGRFKKIFSIIPELYQYTVNTTLVIKIILISVATLVMEILVFWLASKSLGMNYSLYIFIIAVPLITIISALPISLGGLLVREASGIYLLNLLGVDMIYASTIVILLIPIVIISSLPGLYYFLRNSHNEKS